MGVNKDKLTEEHNILKQINECVESNESFCFNAGAGSGKTYALISSLEHALLTNDLLTHSNKSILCITYTNSAKDEIYRRLGINKQVYASTIHEFIWSIMQNQQPVLIKCHLRKIDDNISIIEEFLKETFFDELSNKNKLEFTTLIHKENFVEQFSKNYTKKASPFKEIINSLLADELIQANIIKNVSTFKKVVNNLYKKERLAITKEKIENKEKGYRKVKYNTTYNRDRLDKMEFSHDTLLEYSNWVVDEYDSYGIFKKLIIDRYPLVFIDEYQDTSKYVVQIFKSIYSFAKMKNFPFTLGYFGDSVQSIYTNGIGENINDVHSNLVKIVKRFNRRSKVEIINLINEIRGDDIVQESIFDNNTGGSVDIIELKNEDSLNSEYVQIEELATSLYDDLITNDKDFKEPESFACLVLKLKDLATIRGFKNLYDIIQNMPRFSGSNFNQLNIEVLNSDSRNLGSLMKTLKNMIELKVLSKESKTPISYLLKYKNSEKYNLNLKFTDLQELIQLFRTSSSSSLKSWLIDLVEVSDRYDNVGKYINFLLINQFNLNTEKVKFEDIENSAAKYFKCEEDNDFDILTSFFNISIFEFEKWYSYVSDVFENKINYMTYHSTKGLEFDNLMMVYDSQFAGDNNFFKRYLQNLNAEELSPKDLYKWRSARNLFYVACSRARNNLKLVISQKDYEEVKSGLSTLGFNHPNVE